MARRKGSRPKPLEGYTSMPCGCQKVYGHQASKDGVPDGARVKACEEHDEYLWQRPEVKASTPSRRRHGGDK